MKMLRIYIDFKSPAACLAMAPTFVLAQKLGLTFEYLPFRTRQSAIPAPKSEETKGETHRRVRALAQREMHLKYAVLQGTEMKFRDEPGETDMALAALLYAQSLPEKFMQAAFAAYWAGPQNLNDTAVVKALLDGAGHDASSFDARKYLAELDAVGQEAEALGVIDTPAYVIDGQIFIGREHLPWLETLLTGP